VFHVLNRGVGRMRLFAKVGDYEAFERVLAETLDLRPMRLCAYCVMPELCRGQILTLDRIVLYRTIIGVCTAVDAEARGGACERSALFL